MFTLQWTSNLDSPLETSCFSGVRPPRSSFNLVSPIGRYCFSGGRLSRSSFNLSEPVENPCFSGRRLAAGCFELYVAQPEGTKREASGSVCLDSEYWYLNNLASNFSCVIQNMRCRCFVMKTGG